VRHPALGATLRRVVAEGARGFYEGPVAQEMVDVVRAAGGALSMADLAGYRVIERTPLRARWGSREVITMPAPSAGGVTLLEVLGIYSEAEVRGMGEKTANGQHMIAEAIRGSIADRIHAIGDPAFVPDRTAELLAPDRLAKRRARIGWERTHSPARFDIDEHGTSHVVVTDAEGNVASLTTTINIPFGAAIYAKNAGVILNDELDDFTSVEIGRKFGLPDGGPNAPRAGARPTSSMMPTLVLEQGEPMLALGGSGGFRIAENVVQTLIGRLVFGHTPEEAVSAPRFFAPPSAPALLYGPGQLPPPAVVADLRDRGEQVQSVPHDTSGVQMIAWERGPSGTRVLAGSDPRKGGVAIVVP
jgi:gamma-glutamyltranspeptidase/glutathione hydrolase